MLLYTFKHFIKKILCIFYSRIYGSYGFGARICKPFTLVNNKKHIFLGKNVFIRKFARIEPVVTWYGQTFNPKIIIEDNVIIEQNIHLTCAEKVQIGSCSSISSYVFITDIDHEYQDVEKPIALQPLQVNPTVIGQKCFIGTGVKIMAGVHIGEHSIIGANAVVTHDIPPFCVAAGVPAKVIKRFNFELKQWEVVRDNK